ncbi:MAG: phosphoribosylglycinamide formyltransferase [Bacteroidetes bacterium]|nr:phosphoribosylglycinamide formyltransferase [Bacteroidota bacterium]
MKRIIIFASGQGSNARAILDFFNKEGGAEVVRIVCNKPGAGVLELAQQAGIPTILCRKASLQEPDFIGALRSQQPDLIVLAGFLLQIPPALIAAFPNRIINIHPALLPKWGGQGMWGHHVHEAVLAAGEKLSGITIHQVDEVYDHGAPLLQACCPVLPGDDADKLAARVLRLEHFFLPRLIQFLLAQNES